MNNQYTTIDSLTLAVLEFENKHGTDYPAKIFINMPLKEILMKEYSPTQLTNFGITFAFAGTNQMYFMGIPMQSYYDGSKTPEFYIAEDGREFLQHELIFYNQK